MNHHPQRPGPNSTITAGAAPAGTTRRRRRLLWVGAALAGVAAVWVQPSVATTSPTPPAAAAADRTPQFTAVTTGTAQPRLRFEQTEHRMLPRTRVWRAGRTEQLDRESTTVTGTDEHISKLSVIDRAGDVDVVFALEESPSTAGNEICYSPLSHPVDETTCYSTHIGVGPRHGEVFMELYKPTETSMRGQFRRSYYVNDFQPQRAEVSAAVKSSSLKIYDEIRVDPPALAPGCDDFLELNQDRFTCKHLYELLGTAPVTSTALREGLPRLLQDSSEYELVFAEEFNGASGCSGGWTLDAAFWNHPSHLQSSADGCFQTIVDSRNQPCFNIADGVLLYARTRGPSNCSGDFTTRGKTSIKYGYIEYKYTVNRLRNFNNYQNYYLSLGSPQRTGRSLMGTYGMTLSTYEDLLKNTEMEINLAEFVPTFRHLIEHVYMNEGAFIFSADTPPMRTDKKVYFCRAGSGLSYPSVGCGNNNPITITSGVEWTPRGYQHYIWVDGADESLTRFPKNLSQIRYRSVSRGSDANGRPTIGFGGWDDLSANEHGELFEQLDPDDTDFFLEQAGISHMPLSFTFGAFGWTIAEYMTSQVSVDYIRVFQPRNKYADMEPVYQ